MARRSLKWLLIVLFVVPLLVWGCDRLQTIYWVGSTDLEVKFAIINADTGDPIPGARVEVHSEGGFYEERGKQEFDLVADASGVARKECRKSMCFGARSGLGFTDTFAVHLPWWRYRVSAEGFEPSEWAELDAPEFRRRARRVGPGEAILVVPESLHRMHAEQSVTDRGRG
jgi:hypothetical protein